MRVPASTLRAARALAPVVALLLASGCAALPAERTPAAFDTSPAVAASTRDDARRIGTAEPGARVALASGTLPGLSEVIVGESYPAASGRRCRRLLSTSGARLSRIVCGRGESWRVVRSLESAAVAAPVARVVVPALSRALPGESTGASTGARPDITSVDERSRTEPFMAALDAPGTGAGPHDIIERTLRDGETLWSFAERSTGDGLHWREIAALNGIESPARLEGGTRLAVPSALASE